CFDAGHLLFHLVGDRAVEAQVAVVHYDANRQCRIDRIAVQHRVTVDGARRGKTDAVIKIRYRRDLDIVYDFFDSWHFAGHSESRITADGLFNLADQGHNSVVHRSGDEVEQVVVADAVIGQLAVERRRQFGVRHHGADFNQVAHALYFVHLANFFGGIQLLLINIYLAGEGHNAVLNRRLQVAEFRLLGKRLGDAGFNVTVIAAGHG